MTKIHSNKLFFEEFLRESSAQTLGKFGEYLFEKWCEYKEIPCIRKHKNGIDFIIDDDLYIDVKSVRHLKLKKSLKFRRCDVEKQLPDVKYAYIIFWDGSVELRVESNDSKFGYYDSQIEDSLVQSAWNEFDKKAIKYLDRSHLEKAKLLKKELGEWIRNTLGVEARIIQRKSASNLDGRTGGWGADNFYKEPPHKHKLVVLLGVQNGEVSYIHSYPTDEYSRIEVRPKPVGTNRKKILCYLVGNLASRYKFKDINDFKKNVKSRFGL